MHKQPASVKAVFDRALEIEAGAERQAYLDEACAAAPALRQKVEALLKAYANAGSFLENPAPDLGATVDPQRGRAADNGDPRPSASEAPGPRPLEEGPGSRIGPYKLLQQIGEGGMGVVFMAEQTEPVQRKVALKLIKSGMDSRQVIARFEAERQALALMDHPNIAKVLDAGTTPGEPGCGSAGRPYFVMELVKGVPITRYCDEHHLTPRERLELFLPVCQAVQHAHQKGIIHRDLKPSNVMVCLYDGQPVPKVIDFGVAKAAGPRLTEHTLFTEFGQVIGTFEYMSPEQAELNQLDIDTRSDIYSLGVLLYELLTGTTPLERKRFKAAAFLEVLRLIREEEPPRPSTRLSTAEGLPMIAANRGLDPKKLSGLLRGELDWIVMKTLEKDRNRRYETPHGLVRDIERYLHDETVLACPPSAGYRLRKLARRHKAALGIGLAVALAVLFAVVGLALSTLRSYEEQQRTEEALGQTRHEEREKSEQLWQALVAQARANRLSRRAGQRFESLETLQRATQLARTLDLRADRFHELQSAVIATLALPDLYLAGPWNTYPADTIGFDFDEAHAVYARTDRQGTCSIRRVADDVELHRLPGLGAPADPVLSCDGKFVAVVHLDRDLHGTVAVYVWHLDGLTPRRLLSEAHANTGHFHPNAQQVALPYNDGAIGVFELPSGRQLHRLAPDTLVTREIKVALHPSEPVVAVCSYFGFVVQLRDVRTEKVIASLPQPARPNSVAWSPDGRTLAVGLAESCRIRLYDQTTLQPFRTLETGTSPTYLAFNHAGDRLASRGWGDLLELFDVGTGQKLFATTMQSRTPRFSPDDRRLAGAVQDGKLGIWQVGDSREYRTLVRKALPEKFRYVIGAVHADGRLLAVVMTDGFGLWDLATGSEVAFVPMNVDGVTDLRFEPSGALLTTGLSGLFRWPIRADPDAPDRLLVGPPERLPLRTHCISQSADGRVIVGCNRAVAAWEADAGGWVLHSDRPSQPIRLDAGADIGKIAVSPDGQWVVTVSHARGLVKVWDARDGRPVKQLAEGGNGALHFSPDGRWLYINVDGGRLFAVGSWEPGPSVGGYGVFARDSKLMAVETPEGVIRLVDPATGQEIARLEAPHGNWAKSWMGFTPDGTQLVTVDASAIHVWDLRAIRTRLKTMGLDWDWPEFAPADPGGKVAEPLKVEVLLGDPAKLALIREENARQAIERSRRLMEAKPESAGACNDLAWAYLTAPEAIRDVKAALPLAEKAVRLKPGDAEFRTTLGVAYYRDGRYRQAVETLRPNLASQVDSGLAFDLYFLAMSHHRLGETAPAQAYYAWASRWTRAQPVPSAAPLDELNVLQAEAAELLGIDQKKD